MNGNVLVQKVTKYVQKVAHENTKPSLETLFFMQRSKNRSSKYQLHNLQFEPAGVRTPDLEYVRRTRYNRVGLQHSNNSQFVCYSE